MSKDKVQCGVCGNYTSDYHVEEVEAEHKDQKPYERYVGNDCHEQE